MALDKSTVTVYTSAMSTESAQSPLREAREAAGMSQNELAMRVGVTKQAISQFESGATRPSLPIAGALALALQTTVDALFFGTESNTTVDDSAATAPATGGTSAPQATERPEDADKSAGAAA